MPRLQRYVGLVCFLACESVLKRKKLQKTDEKPKHKVGKSSITPPQILLKFCTDFDTWHSMYYKHSRSRDQRSRSWRDITYQQYNVI